MCVSARLSTELVQKTAVADALAAVGVDASTSAASSSPAAAA
jgi:formate dehydrogenase assembly factor FdhD